MKPAMLVDSLWVLGTRFLLRGANFLIFLLLARALTVGEFGFYGYLMSTAVVLSVGFDLGLRQSTASLLGQAAPGERAAVVTHMLALWLLLALLATLATYGILVGGGYAATYGPVALVAAFGTAPDAVPAHRPGRLPRPRRARQAEPERDHLPRRHAGRHGGPVAHAPPRPRQRRLDPRPRPRRGRPLPPAPDPRRPRPAHPPRPRLSPAACCGPAPSSPAAPS